MTTDTFNKFLIEICNINNFNDAERKEFIDNVTKGINLNLIIDGAELVKIKDNNIAEFFKELINHPQGKEIIEKRFSMVVGEILEVNKEKISSEKMKELLKILG